MKRCTQSPVLDNYSVWDWHCGAQEVGRCSVLWLRWSHKLFTTVKLSDQGRLAASVAFCQTSDMHQIKEWIHLVCHWSCFSMPSDLSSHVLSMYQKGKNVSLQASTCESWTGLHQAGSPCKLQHQCFPSQDFRSHPINLIIHGVLLCHCISHWQCFYGMHIYESDAVWYYPWLSLMSKHNFQPMEGETTQSSLLLLGLLHINTREVIQEVSKNKRGGKGFNVPCKLWREGIEYLCLFSCRFSV